ncbi:MAG TPA: YdeI/OmpD-associated family protein [Solirubrobacteraceae bacterium]|nr:YdeI/OmpD-associated family protein [Solirubrobacteraceae bacterium]
MPPNDLPIVEFPDRSAWERWLEVHHESSAGVWLKIAKKGSGATTLTYAEALEHALCYGWIDGQKGPSDRIFWLQRFVPRGPRSKWSQVNRRKATELIEQGRMRPAGIEQVEAAKRDGRWEAAYAPQSTVTVPEDFQAALDANPTANEFFATLKRSERYSFLYRIHDAKRPETRALRVNEYVAMLSEGKTIHGRPGDGSRSR